MRLHRLVIRAWGPFPGEHEIDLDRLGQAGLFLIHGVTGSGKTSVLDAICFALYGDVPGARSRASLRSDHAGADSQPLVELEFTAGGRHLRVRRCPEFFRPKKRGDGLTKVQPSVILDELSGGRWVTRGTRLDEVGLVVKDVVGLDLEQFQSVVLLPQGRFAEFLLARPDDRRELLERLFDTGRFAQIEAWLADRRRMATDRLSVRRSELAQTMVRVDDVLAGSGLATHAGWGGDLPVDEVVAALQGVRSALSAEASTALAHAELATAGAAESDAAWFSGRSVLERQREGARAGAELAAVAAARGLCEEAAASIRAAERAAAVSGFVAAASHARAGADKAVRSLEAAHARVSDVATPTLEPSVARAIYDAVAAQSAVLDGARAASEVLGRERSVADGHERAMVAAGRLRSRLAGMLAQQRSALRGVEARLGAERELAAVLSERRSRCHDLGRAISLLRRIEVLTREAAALRAAVELRREVWVSAREQAVLLQEQRVAGMAAVLAASLTYGLPCAVCGSPTHPAPAARDADEVTRAQLDSSSERVEVALQALRDQETQLAGRGATIDAMVHEVSAVPLPELAPVLATLPDQPVLGTTATGGRSSAVAWERAAPEVALALESALRVAEHLREESIAAREREVGSVAESAMLTASIRAQEGELAAADTAADRSTALLAEARHRADASAALMGSSLSRHASLCPCAPRPSIGRDAADLDTAISRHRSVLTALADWHLAVRERGSADQQLQSARFHEAEALTLHGFVAVDEVHAAALPPDALHALTDLLHATESRRAGAAAILAQPEVAAAMAMSEPDLPSLELRRTAAGDALRAAAARHTLLEHAVGQLQQLHGDVETAVRLLSPAEAELAVVKELADCVGGSSGDNSLRMRLSAYVLAARLEEIVALANERLTTLSDGRFQLQHSDGLAGRGARSGLGLRVLDAWTGVSRETTSLSGGEAFMASLSLALGLGDAVRAEAGGFDLQTLFVDEGFGTLDEDSLELVIGVLDGLRDGGRSVGIVSHVTELRLRIPAQLQVSKGQAGSSLSVLVDLTSSSAA